MDILFVAIILAIIILVILIIYLLFKMQVIRLIPTQDSPTTDKDSTIFQPVELKYGGYKTVIFPDQLVNADSPVYTMGFGLRVNGTDTTQTQPLFNTGNIKYHLDKLRLMYSTTVSLVGGSLCDGVLLQSWNYFVFVVNSGGILSVFLNGKFVFSAQLSADLLVRGNPLIEFGGPPNGDITIARFQFWPYALDFQKVTQVYGEFSKAI